MALETEAGVFLSGKEAAPKLGITYRTFGNKRTEHGDDFLRGYELVPGRVFFRLQDVERLARERSK